MIVIGIVILIIAVAGIIFFVSSSQQYERIDITPNGTSIEVPYNKTTYEGEFESAKVWDWDEGMLITYNSNADKNYLKVTKMGFESLNELIKSSGEKQDFGGQTGYVIDADKLLEIHLFDMIKVNYKGKFYCIQLSNNTTHDNILICCKDKDMAIHMSQSVEYKNVYKNKTTDIEDTIEAVDNISKDVGTLTNEYEKYVNSTDNNSSTNNNNSSAIAMGFDLDNNINKIESIITKLHI